MTRSLDSEFEKDQTGYYVKYASKGVGRPAGPIDVYRVRMLENNSDSESNWLEYRLEVLEVEKTSSRYGPKIGEKFTCHKQREGVTSNFWRLLKDIDGIKQPL
jgi:hypothetical protein